MIGSQSTIGRLAHPVAVMTAMMVAIALGVVDAPAARAVVPPASPTTSVITVKVGGDRQADGSVGPLAGVVLQLLTYTGSATTPGAAVGTAWSTCTSDADGDCSFVVPSTNVSQTQGGNQNRRFWVSQVSAPGTWYTNPTLRTGTSTAAETTAQPYRFLTGTQLQPNQTYRSGSDFMNTITGGTAASQRPSSGGIWQQSRANPAVTDKCGLNVALILDLSGSVGDQIGALRNAADAFVNSLVGTPSRMSVFSFSWGSPAQNASQNHPGLQPVSDAAGAATVRSWVADGTPNGGTNWDRGLSAAADANGPRPAADRYDLAIVITDGNPTNWGGTGTTSGTVNGNGSNNRLVEVERAIFSANELKSQGTRVVAFGVGAGVTDATTAHNLRAISGRTAYDGTNAAAADYYQESSFADAAGALGRLALTTCGGTISVVKMLVPPGTTGEDISGAEPAPEGWAFAASTTATPPVPVDPPSATTTDDGTGSVNFALDFSGGAASADATITETQHPGHTLVTQGGANAVCTDLSTGAGVPVTNVGVPTDLNPGFTVTANGPPNEDAISCVMYDRRPTPPADVTVDKDWVVDVGGVRTTYADGDQPDFLQAQLSLTDPDGVAHEQGWGVTADGYAAGDTPTLDEAVQVDRPLCDLTSQSVTEANGATVSEPLPYTPTLAAGSNHYTVTNAVTCSTRLTLVKVVHNEGTDRTGTPSDWTLTADGPTHVSGPGDSPEVTGQTIDAGDYHLSESGGPAGYDPNQWYCDGTEHTAPARIAADIGQDITCTIENTAVVARPESGRPTVRTHTSHRRVRTGRPFLDRIHVAGIAGGHGATATARLYGPFASRAAATCRAPFQVRSKTLHVHNGANRTARVRIHAPGVYTWRVTLHADAANRSATHPCGQAVETTVVAKPAYPAPVVNGGFSGTIRHGEGLAARRAVTTIRMPAIGLDAVVYAEPIVRGQMRLPDDVSKVGWLRRSDAAGDAIGVTVIGGHVSDRHDSPGALYRLSSAHRGEIVTMSQGGRQVRFRVTGKATYTRAGHLPKRYFSTTGGHRLVLISCTDKVVYPNGHFHYTRYQVVEARRVR